MKLTDQQLRVRLRRHLQEVKQQSLLDTPKQSQDLQVKHVRIRKQKSMRNSKQQQTTRATTDQTNHSMARAFPECHVHINLHRTKQRWLLTRRRGRHHQISRPQPFLRSATHHAHHATLHAASTMARNTAAYGPSSFYHVRASKRSHRSRHYPMRARQAYQ